MRLQYKWWWTAGILLIVLGAIQGLVSGWQDVAASGLVTSGIIVVIVMLGKDLRREEGPKQDERTKRIGAWGLSYSWFLTFVTLFILFWVQYLGLIVLETNIVLLFLVLEMAVSARGFQWYFFRKGDVE
jgi:hypothetical protein